VGNRNTNVLEAYDVSSSGAVGDGFHQMYRQATEGPVDAIFGDYLSEMNIGWRALEVCTRSRYITGILIQTVS